LCNAGWEIRDGNKWWLQMMWANLTDEFM
jgi:hypothetical protein